jgi:Na+-transporting NADH:ubiquinone oxidoreductase subunit NqrF
MFSIFKQKKADPCRVDINNGELVINVQQDETLLAAALRHGVPYPHNCRVGTCGQCKTKLVSGKIKPLMDFALSPLTAEELRSGYVLACQSKVRSNLYISIHTDHAESRAGKIVLAQQLPGDVLSLSIELDQALEFEAGQYANLSMQDSDLARSYSFSQEPLPGGNRLVSFLIRRIPGGAFSDHLWHNAKPGMFMSLIGPYGSMGAADIDANVICVAGGTGLAPVLSIVRDRLLKSTSARFLILLGVRHQGDYFADEIFKELERLASGRVQTRVILSDEPSESDWKGDRGLVTSLITKELLEEVQASTAIVCGAAPMVKASQEELRRLGVSDKDIHTDAFVPSGK